VRRQAAEVVDTCVANRVRRLNRVVTRLYNDRLRPAGMTIAEMNLLVAVAANGPTRASQLGRGLEMEKSTVSRNLARLADRGWVVAHDNPGGTGLLIDITDDGATAIEGAMPAWEQAQRKVVDIVGDDGLFVDSARTIR
jgi:DNA-binding MarR family transcriptional regulator